MLINTGVSLAAKLPLKHRNNSFAFTGTIQKKQLFFLLRHDDDLVLVPISKVRVAVQKIKRFQIGNIFQLYAFNWKISQKANILHC